MVELNGAVSVFVALLVALLIVLGSISLLETVS